MQPRKPLAHGRYGIGGSSDTIGQAGQSGLTRLAWCDPVGFAKQPRKGAEVFESITLSDPFYALVRIFGGSDLLKSAIEPLLADIERDAADRLEQSIQRCP